MKTMKPIPSTLIIYLILFLEVSNSESLTENALTQKYLEKLAKSGYNPQIMPEPTDGEGEPVYITCSMYILDIYKVDDKNMEFEAKFIFRQSWRDQRLAYSDQDIKKIVLNDAKSIWTPDLYFLQEKTGFLHNIIKPNVYIKIQTNGSVLFSERLTMSFSCPMDFSKFPHDTHKCTIAAESFGYYANKLEILWFGSIGSSKNFNLPFRVTNIKEDTENMSLSTGNYTALEVEFTFQRKVGFFITRLYVPYIFLTFLSWISFWIPVKLAAHRLSLLLVILYLMVNIGNDINTHVPKSSYTKGSDVWIAVCQSLVFASFLEFIVAHMVDTIKVDYQNELNKNDPEDRNVQDPDAKMNHSENKELSNKAFNNISTRLLKMDVLQSGSMDKGSRLLFPILFICFNFIYCIVYCTGN